MRCLRKSTFAMARIGHAPFSFWPVEEREREKACRCQVSKFEKSKRKKKGGGRGEGAAAHCLVMRCAVRKKRQQRLTEDWDFDGMELDPLDRKVCTGRLVLMLCFRFDLSWEVVVEL